MVLYVTEKEMIQRFADGLDKAASRAKEFLTAKEQDRPQLFVEFLNGIKVAAGSSHQLAHTQVDHAPQWLALRDKLEAVLEAGQDLPMYRQTQNGLWLTIKKSLEQLRDKGLRLATQKAFSRDEVLAGMNLRQMKANEEINKEHNENNNNG